MPKETLFKTLILLLKLSVTPLEKETSKFIYELLSNKNIDINNDDYFSQNKKDMAKISGSQFKNDKCLLRAEYAGNYASYFLLKYLMDLGLVNRNEELMKFLMIRTANDSMGQEYSGVFIIEFANDNISVREVRAINRALLDNNELFSVAGLTMLVMMAKKDKTLAFDEFSYSGKRIPMAEGYTSTTFGIDNTEKREVSAKSMWDWTREDYLVAVKIADKLKESMLDIFIDIQAISEEENRKHSVAIIKNRKSIFQRMIDKIKCVFNR